MKTNNQKGFAHGIVLVVIALVVIAGAGWLVYKHQNPSGKVANSTTTAGASSQTVNTSPTASNVSTAPKVSSTADLDNALKVLDANDPSTANSSDSSQLSSQSSF